MVCIWLPASGGSTKQYLIQQKVFLAPLEILWSSRKSLYLFSASHCFQAWTGCRKTGFTVSGKPDQRSIPSHASAV